MAANTYALMDALSEGDAPFSNPHHWGGYGYEEVPQNQYAYSMFGIQNSIVVEMRHLGVHRVDTTESPPDIGADWTLQDTGDNKTNVFRYIVNGGGGALYNSDDITNIAKAMTLDDLYLLANNLVWCYHNLVSFGAYTEFTSGYYQYPERYQNEADPEFGYIPTYIPELANSFSHFSQFLTLASTYDAANTTVNAHAAIYTAINATSVHVISNNATFHANGTNMALDKGPTMNVMAMWLYTANGTDSVSVGSGAAGHSRPAGLEIDKVDDSHPAESMTPKEVCNEFIRATNVYTYMVRSYLTDSRPAGDYDPLPGVTPANTFIYEARDWLAKRAKAQGLIDIMSRTTLPGTTSTAIQNAIANTGT